MNILPIEIERMKELREQGWSFEKIGLEIGVHPNSVRYHLVTKPKITEARKEREKRRAVGSRAIQE